MRTAVLAILIFFFAPMAHAACVQNPEDGTYYDNVTLASCTPDSTQAAITNPQNRPAITNPSTNIQLINPLKGGGNLETFLLGILDFVIRIGTIIVILMLVYVGYLFVVAQGEPAKITTARSALLWTVVGALILLGSKAIALAIEATVKAISAGG